MYKNQIFTNSSKWMPIFLLLIITGMAGCEKDKERAPEINYEEKYRKEFVNLTCLPPFVQSEKDSLVGKWRLVYWADRLIEPTEEIDYSCDTIIYEFRTDGTLLVTSNTEEYPGGKYTYEYTVLVIPVMPSKATPAPNLRIGETEWYFCTVSETSMSVGGNGQRFAKTFIKHQK